MIIKRNRIRCIKCGDVIESKHRHDFVVCSCWEEVNGKGCAVDGGKDYLRRLGNDWDDMSEVEYE